MRNLLFALILSAGILSAATISSITCSGQVATVNATSHGIAQYQGFSISGTAGTFNSTANTASTNSLTFILPAGTACSGFTSGYTTIVQAKQIISIGNSQNPQYGNVTLTYLYWFTTVTPIVPACAPSCVSAWSSASGAENAAISAGTTVEVQGAITVSASTSAASIQSTVISQYTAIQTAYGNGLLSGIGYWYNGSTWQN